MVQPLVSFMPSMVAAEDSSKCHGSARVDIVSSCAGGPLDPGGGAAAGDVEDAGDDVDVVRHTAVIDVQIADRERGAARQVALVDREVGFPSGVRRAVRHAAVVDSEVAVGVKRGVVRLAVEEDIHIIAVAQVKAGAGHAAGNVVR